MPASVEAVVAKVDDLKDGEMKTVDICEGGKALLVKDNGQFSAVGHKCTHYGAPLSTGAYLNGRVRCPWHGACFNTKTGDIEDFPGLDSLQKFEVEVKNGDVIVKAEVEQFKSHKKVKDMENHCPSVDSRTFVVVGGGGSALACAQTLRQEGFKGRLVLASAETFLPYDRPKLSKMLNSTGDSLCLKNEEFFKSSDIEFLPEKMATQADIQNKVVTFKDKTSIKYDKIVFATGGKPRGMNCPGSDLENVLLLRSPVDANKIASVIEGGNVVVVGTSFIGMEVAAFCMSDKGKAKSVTVIGRSKTPFKNVLGETIGNQLKQLHIDRGVKFEFETAVEEFQGKGGKLTHVTLKNGKTLPADVCILGIGVTPSTDFLKDSGVPLTPTGAVIVDKYMKACDSVYAAGDIAAFPLKMENWAQVNIGHWQLAAKLGRVAALNMLEKNVVINTVPFFWTSMFGKTVRYCGHASSFDEVNIDGNVEEYKFIAYYIKDDRVLALATMGWGPIAAHAANLMYESKMPSATEIKANPNEWYSCLKL